MLTKETLPYLEYDIAESLERQKNIEILLNNLNGKGLEEKVKNFASRYNLNYNYVFNKIKTDKVFAVQFAKDPAKQSFHQNRAANFIKNLPFVSNFKLLPARGENALYVINGVVFNGKDLGNMKKPKSIDFYWEYGFKTKKIEFYATHKFTRLNGGSQDNQFEDVCNFLDNARNSTNPNNYIFSITDGDYYLLSYSKYKTENLNKIEYLNRQFYGAYCKASCSNRLLKNMLEYIKKWLKSNFKDSEISEEISNINYIINLYE